MSNNDWKERFAASHDPQVSSCWVEYGLDEGTIEKIDFGRLEAFIAEERKAVAKDVMTQMGGCCEHGEDCMNLDELQKAYELL